MLIENFNASKGNGTLIRQALSLLYQVNFFGVMMEEAELQSRPVLPTQVTLESAALRAAWRDGFYAALTTMYEMPTRFEEIKEESKATPRPTFGAGESMIREKDITPEEHEELYGRKPSSE